MNWSDFFAMGGYGFYVWGTYLFAAVVLIINIIVPLHRKKAVMKMLRGLAQIDKGSSE